MTPFDIFIFFTIYLLWVVTFIGIGHILLTFCKVPEEYGYLIRGFVGMAAVAIAATTYHFILPLDIAFLFLMALVGISGWWGLTGAQKPSYKTITYAAMGFAIFAIIPLFWHRYYDTGLYHLQAIRWILEQPLQLGLANLHSRLGYNSLWFSLESAVDFLVVMKGVPYFLLNGIAVFLYTTPIVNILKNKNFSSSNLFYLLTLIPIIGYAGIFLTSASSDLFMMLITFTVFIVFVKEYDDPFKNEQLVFVAVVLSGFSGMIKLFGFILFFFALWVYFRHYGIKNLWAAVMFIPWLIQGIATSGYIAFPLAFTRLPLLWSVPSDIAKLDANGVVAWARMQGADSFFTTLGNNNWVLHWILSPMVLMILVEVSILVILTLVIKPVIHRDRYIPIIFAFFGVLLWYWIAPEPRYALGFIFALPLVVLAYAMDTQLKTGSVKSRKLVEGCFAILAILAVVQGALIYTYTHTDDPFEIPVNRDVSATVYGITVFGSQDQAWNAEIPTTPYLDERFYYGRLKLIGMEIPIAFMGIMR